MNQNDLPLLNDKECAQQVGQRLCFARQSLGLTTEVLAELLGTSADKITEVEQGKLFLPIPWGNKLYRFLGINVNWLLTGEEKITTGKIHFYDDLVYHMQVPEVEKCIMVKLIEARITFNDEIRDYERGHGVSFAATPQ